MDEAQDEKRNEVADRQIGASVTEAEREALRRLAFDQRRSVSAVVRAAIQRYLMDAE